MAGVEQEMHRGAGRRHQGVDIGLRLHDRAHVVVVDELQPSALSELGELGDAPAILAQSPSFSTGRWDSVFERSPCMAFEVSATMNTAVPIALSRSTWARAAANSVSASRRQQLDRIPAADAGEAEGGERRLQRVGLARELVAELHALEADFLGLARGRSPAASRRRAPACRRSTSRWGLPRCGWA